MLHWLHSLLPHIPHHGYVLVFIVVLLNNLGLPLPGETILLGAGFMLGKTADSLWQPMAAGTAASFLGGICAFWLGRRLGQGSLEKIHWLHLTPERLKWPEQFFKRHGAKAVFIARFIALFPPVAANLLAGMAKNSLAKFSILQSHRFGGLCGQLHPDRIFLWEAVEASCSLVGASGALSDSGGDGRPRSGRGFQTLHFRFLGASVRRETIVCRFIQDIARLVRKNRTFQKLKVVHKFHMI